MCRVELVVEQAKAPEILEDIHQNQEIGLEVHVMVISETPTTKAFPDFTCMLIVLFRDGFLF